jgi:hypothetical protein
MFNSIDKKMKYAIALLVAGLLRVAPAMSQVGQEMKAFRDREGVSVTLLAPELYNLYLKGNPGETLKAFKEINVLRVDRSRAAASLKEEIERRVNPILDNETRYSLASSRRGAGREERLYVSREEGEITALVLWSETEREIALVELKGNIRAEKARALPDILQVRGLEGLANLLAPEEEEAPFAAGRFPRRPRLSLDSLAAGSILEEFDRLFGNMPDPFEGFGDIDAMMKELSERAGDQGTFSTSRGLAVTRENGKTRIQVNGSNVDILYLIDGKLFAADTLESIPEDIATVDMLDAPDDPGKSYVVINTSRVSGRFISFSGGVLRFRRENQDYAFNIDKLPAPALLINNRPSRDFRVDPADIIQVRPATDLERALCGFSSVQVVIVTR